MSLTCQQCGAFADNGKVCDGCAKKNEHSLNSARPFSREQEEQIARIEAAYLEEHGEDYDPTPD